ncbi:haloacid dehalogenase type II [Pelomonas sp. KK5]|uniref:haloacid dehalogenase type II n=1 Tax=Pelomonas sp. KK5 TaxID=1855730 RepID=UPI00097C83CC|nr:haloacid dehalogenase type II [Pelomonas sp. KK5]
MPRPRALAFDIFGTVVDWRSGVAAHVRDFLAASLPGTDAHAFADDWRRLYQPAMEACRNGSRPFTKLDQLHLEMLTELLRRKGLDPLPDVATLHALSHAWRRLPAWPDVPEGLAALRRLMPVVTLSNANVALMVAMNRFNGGLAWDAILGAEFSQHYKPEPQAYLRTAEALDLQPGELCLVAAHHSDLAAARACGLQAAYVDRPMEYGGATAPDAAMAQRWEFHATSLVDLAAQLSARDAG